jgi:hypothetical protein
MTEAYVDIINDITVMYRRDLSASDLSLIGEFRRENIARWLRSDRMDIYGFTDFHAVCGDIDIPWTTEEGRYAESAQETDKRWAEQNSARNKRWLEQNSAGGGTNGEAIH